MVGTAIVGAGVLGAGATAYSANKAASAQEDAANQANQTEQQFFNTANQNLQPYIQTGNNAATQVSNLEGLNGGNSASIQSTLEGLPGYQFALDQGLESVQNSATARGLGVSGAAQKGAANYATGLANEYYNNYLTGIQNTENTGESAAASLAGDAVSTGSGIASNQVGAGNAAAAASNSTGGAIGNIGNSLIASQLLQQTQNDSTLYGNVNNALNTSGNSANIGSYNLGQIATQPGASENGLGTGINWGF